MKEGIVVFVVALITLLSASVAGGAEVHARAHARTKDPIHFRFQSVSSTIAKAQAQAKVKVQTKSKTTAHAQAKTAASVAHAGEKHSAALHQNTAHTHHPANTVAAAAPRFMATGEKLVVADPISDKEEPGTGTKADGNGKEDPKPDEADKCTEKVSTTFCSMVDWNVAASKVPKDGGNTEMMIEMSYYNQPGSWDCKKEYKELSCRLNYPICTKSQPVQTPCRSVCDDFARRCPGANMQCEEYAVGGDCYNFNYLDEVAKREASRGVGGLKGWPSAAIAAVVIVVIVGFASMAGKKNRKGSADSEEISLLNADEAKVEDAAI